MTTSATRPAPTPDAAPDLEPAPVDRQTYATRRRRHVVDAAATLGLMLALAVLVRADLIVPQMPGGVGRPAMAFALLLAMAWVVAKFHPRLAVQGPQPLRWAAAGYLCAVMLAYAAAQMRGLTALEAGGADRAIIVTAVFLGVILVCADGIPDRSRLDELIRVLIGLCTAMAVIGIIQSVTGLNIVNYVDLPGLASTRGDEFLDLGSGFRVRGDGLFQVSSTAAHYIEFSAVMALALPLAIHLARFNRTRPGRQWAFLATLAIGAVIPLTLSRTGILAAAVGLALLAISGTVRAAFNMVVVAGSVLAAMTVLRPGVLGTIRSLFTNLSDDPSVQGRTEDYTSAISYLAERPWLGRGPGTFIPVLYDWIDNEWLLHLITAGLIGTAALAALHLTAISLAAISFRRARRGADRHLCACLIVVQVMAVLMNGTYDAMSFTTHLLVLAVLTGAAGAMWRFTHPAPQVCSAASLPLGKA